MGSEESVIGQKAIHDKIQSLDLQQVYAKIKQVDSHSTLDNGIVVQVTGELSIGGHPMRAFVQTFVLAPETPKKFYVHNDIFRYQDDDLVSESETNDTPGEGETTPLLEQAVTDNCDFNSEKEAVVGGESEASEAVRGMYDSQNAELGDSSVNIPGTADAQQTADLSTGAWGQFGDAAHVGEVTQNGVEATTPQPPQEFPSATEPVEDRQDEETFPSGETPEQDNKTSTWASRLSQQSGNRPLNSTAIPTSQSLPQRDPRPRRTENRSQNQPLTSGLKDKKSGPTPRDTPDNHQVFVGGLPPNTLESELRDVFKEFGNVLDIRVNAKNFAFVVFDNAKPVTKVMNLKEPLEIRGKNLNIEEKRAPRSGRGGDRDRNRGGAPAGPGGKPRGGKPVKR